jgi:hypothetical protein
MVLWRYGIADKLPYNKTMGVIPDEKFGMTSFFDASVTQVFGLFIFVFAAICSTSRSRYH